jgi:hypothetical protein
MSKSPRKQAGSEHAEAPLPLVSAPLAARVLGISRRQFDRLLGRAVFRRADVATGVRQRFDVSQVVRAYVGYLQDGKEGSTDIAQARLKYLDAQRKAVELRTREREGELLERAEVARVFEAALVQVGAALEGLPGRFAGEIAAISGEPAQVREKLADECRRVREQAATELRALADRVARGDALDAAAEAHSGQMGGDE